MEIFYSKLIGQPIISRDLETKIARISDLIIDTDRGVMVALQTNKMDYLIAGPDIVNLSPPIEINDTSSLISSEEVPAIKHILKKNIRLRDNCVKTKAGKMVGKVKDYAIDSLTLQITKLYATQSIFGLSLDQRIIPWQEIIAIKKEAIIVKDDRILVKSRLKNPFWAKKELTPERC